jgi:hypothetical protein
VLNLYRLVSYNGTGALGSSVALLEMSFMFNQASTESVSTLKKENSFPVHTFPQAGNGRSF